MLTIFHSPKCLEYETRGHPESPQRIRWALEALKPHKQIEWRQPAPCSDEDILRVHSEEHLLSVKTGGFFDADTSADPAMYCHAKLSAGAAIGAAECALNGRAAFSLMRPPGHHAERNRVMGFCYFNNIAVAVAKVLASAPQRSPIAILDFDCHHGNGTEDIFRGDDRVLFVSLHQSPCYPETGLRSHGNILNYPLPPRTGETAFLRAFDDALQKIAEVTPSLLAVSAGFDAFKGDPITEMGLEVETFGKIGERIAATRLPTFAALEGGYSPQLGQCLESFLLGWGMEL